MSSLKSFRIWITLITTLVTFSHATDGTLTFDEYMAQVKEKHLGVKGLDESSSGALLRSDEGALLVTPTLFANFQYSNDAKPTNNPAFMGTNTKFDGYSLGLSQQTKFGLGAKLSYNITHTLITGANPAMLPQHEFYENRPMLELSLSLLKNGFGRETRAIQELSEAQALATHFGDRFKAKVTLAEAEATYWRLSLAREIVTVQTESVDRAKKLRDWNARRTRLSLADRSGQLQAEAGLKVRTLELQASTDELESAGRAFNRARGIESAQVVEKLTILSIEMLEKMPVPERKGQRDDVQAAKQLERLATANADVGREKNTPTLDLYSTLALNGRDPAFGPSFSQSLGTEFPTFQLGIKFQTPLGLGVLGSDREAYAREQKAAELNYQRKLFEESSEWSELTQKLAETKKRLTLALAIEDAQREKLDHERDRLKKGQSVTYQVIQFEEEFAGSQLMRIKIESEILKLIAQMRTFGGDRDAS